MARAEDIRDKESLRAWLEGQPREVVVAIASRAALRVTPVWANFCLTSDARKRDLTALPILRLNLISSVAAVSPTDDIRRAAASSASAASSAASSAFAAFADASSAAFAAAFAAADAASSAADASAAADAADAADASSAASAFAAFAAFAAADASSAADAAVWHSIRLDAGAVEQGGDCLSLPLWPDENPLEEQWQQVRAEWSKFRSTYGFWLRWYESLLKGDLTVSDLFYRIALIPDEIWMRGADAVADEIERFEAPFYASEEWSSHEMLNGAIEQQERLLRDLQSQLELEKSRAKSLEGDAERQSNLVRDLSKQVGSLQGKLNAVEGEANDQLARLEESYKRNFEAAIEAFKQEQITKAPVELWQDKQKEHEDKSKASYRWFAFGLGVVVAAAVSVLLVALFRHDWIISLFAPATCDPISKPYACSGFGAQGFIVGGAIVTILSVLLWFTRLRMKIFLAERHLSLDARERRAFVQTYLGLLQEGDTSGEAREARSVVYHALYRPSSDGTVKDDGGLDVSIGAAVSKFLSN